MGKIIDENVVQLQFDNKQFEQNVKGTMSTLDKLKQKLGFKKEVDDVDKLGKSINNVKLDPLSSAVDAIKVKFSALQIAGTTALVNITNSAINAGKNMMSALTIDPVKTGFNEYELKMNSVKTIMSSTGESVQTVNKYLDELNTYADRTIYTFSDMTQNIGKFTNAGVNLKDAVGAIKGISNEAAISGASAEEASRAMYNFSQALSMGYVQMIDWKSIENANMATVDFKKNLIDTAVSMGKVKVAGKDMYKAGKETLNLQGMFKDGLKEQWLTSEVLLKTLNKYSDETTELGKRAYSAAGDVSKLTQVFDIAKETAQSGWAQTWQILVGDIDEAKRILTPISNAINKVIDTMADARNKILNSALSKSFKDLKTNVDKVMTSFKTFSKPIEQITKSLDDYKKVVDSILKGDYGSGKKRFEKLAEEGFDYAKAQNLVNEKLKSKVRLDEKAAETTKKLTNETDKLIDTNEKNYDVLNDVIGEKFTAIRELSELTNEQLKAKGYNDDEIEKLREHVRTMQEIARNTALNTESQEAYLESLTTFNKEQLLNLGYSKEQAESLSQLIELFRKTGIPINELVKNLDNLNGRFLIFRSITNIGTAIYTVFKAIGDGFRAVFEPLNGDKLFNLIAGFNKITESLKNFTTRNAEHIMRTFRGLFSILGIGADIIKFLSQIIIRFVNVILEQLNFNLLETTGNIGDLINSFRLWIKEHILSSKNLEKILSIVTNLALRFWIYIKSISQSYYGII